ncbi:hypothetical protein BB559_003202 [Furculomyces boomerangus]|uniref:Xylulose kinase n=1 Tax=Furculomyces boomerangus TaxID=61424 RepID=A0A2T9YMY1_9FUNG|nr:hypothetical protein BB559_003202 [Furculomyces boomerangus]
MNLFLGLDLSTQQLKAVVFNQNGNLVTHQSINFDTDLPHYKTINGRILGTNHTVTSPTLMWVEAIDLLFKRLSLNLGPLAKNIVSIGGAAQQHGSVYWKNLEKIVLNPESSLVEQLSTNSIFTVLNSPTWEDSSTTKYCEKLHSIHGPSKIASITGSTCYERFTGNQIAKIRDIFPEEWSVTERVSLVSSFLPSILMGKYAPIEVSDASGMNLLDLQTSKWSHDLCDNELLQKLGPDPVHSGTPLGNINQYYVQKYGFNCEVLAMTGDNPGGLIFIEQLAPPINPKDKLTLVVSLGTSDTVIFSLNKYPYTDPSETNTRSIYSGHVLAHPTKNVWATLLCYKNGSLAREFISDNLCMNGNVNGIDKWTSFEKAGSDNMEESEFGFYYLMPEIIPNAHGIHRFSLLKDSNSGNNSDSNSMEKGLVTIMKKKFIHKTQILDPSSKENVFTASPLDARLIVESQFMSMRLDCSRKGVDLGSDIGEIVVTGGASASKFISQTLSDVFNVDVYTISEKNMNQGDNLARHDISTLSMPALGGAANAMSSYAQSKSEVGRIEGCHLPYELKIKCSPNEKMKDYYNTKMEMFSNLRDYLENQS